MASSPEKTEQNATSCEIGGGRAVKCRARVALRLRRGVREKNGLEEKKKKRMGWRDPQLINETGDCKPREKREV